MPTEKGVEDVNIGTAENPNMVKFSKALPPQVKAKYISLLSSFTDVFAWDYSDLKEYNKIIIHHIILIKPNQNPFCQKLRRINPKPLPSIEKEVNRLYKAGIIVPIRFSEWISNLVLVRKKTVEIRLCIDFRILNKGQNNIHHPMGAFHYAKMPFRLKNVGATFQRLMDITFANEKDVFLVVYLDDLIVFSNSNEEHIYHLKIAFQQCRKYGISLNPKKILFSMDEGKLLGHIISKEGIRIDPARVEAI
eukprot:PITA_22796